MTWLERDDAISTELKSLWRERARLVVELARLRMERDERQRNEVDWAFRLLVSRVSTMLHYSPTISRALIEENRRESEAALASWQGGGFVGFNFEARDDETAAATIVASLSWLPPHVGYRPRTIREKR